MKLHWSPRSPFVRKVMIVAHELGLVGEIECVRSIALRTKANPAIIQDSPVGRIPVLVLPDGVVLSGSYAICDYLDSLAGSGRVIPKGEQKWQEIELHGVADGLLETLIFWRWEFVVPPEQCRQDISDTCEIKVEACLSWLEKKVDVFASCDYAIGQITVGVALDYLDFRFEQIDWRSSCPNLAKWHKTFQQRVSSMATEVINDE